MSGSLFARPHWAATFKPGTTALGHHWELVDPEADDAPLGRTRRVYKNTLFRTITVTGMDSGNDIRADVFDGDERVAQVFSAWRTKPGTRTVELRRADDTLLGTSANDHKAHRLALLDSGGSEVGRLFYEGEDPWPVLDAAGTKIGAVVRQPFAYTEYSLLEDAVLGWAPGEHARDFQRTFHLGIGASMRYEVVLDPAAAPAEPLRTLASALPLLAAHSY